jgi:hypothetical protein
MDIHLLVAGIDVQCKLNQTATMISKLLHLADRSEIATGESL